MIVKFYKFLIYRKLMKQGIKGFELKIIEKSLFQNQQKSEPNLGENEEQNNLNHEINCLNLL